MKFGILVHTHGDFILIQQSVDPALGGVPHPHFSDTFKALHRTVTPRHWIGTIHLHLSIVSFAHGDINNYIYLDSYLLVKVAFYINSWTTIDTLTFHTNLLTFGI